MGTSGEELQEIIYVDEKRLDTYFEQISNPVKFDKIPEWDGEITAGGLIPKLEVQAGRKQKNHPRPYTLVEKVKIFYDYMEKNNLITDNRPVDPFEDDKSSFFRFETMYAYKGSVPAPKHRNDLGSLIIWVSPQPNKQSGQAVSEDSDEAGTLFLLEDFRVPDKDPIAFSSYSTLLLFMEDEVYPAIEYSALASLNERDKKVSALLATDPVLALSRLGAVFGRERLIKTIYRFIATCNEEDNDFSVTIIGYPIVIWG